MTRIFISYDRDDRPFTRQIAGNLRRVYGHVWFDENLYGGEDWWEEIRKQIDNCDIFMYLLSDGSANSPYCHQEHAEARRLSKEILPVRIAQVNNIPDFLSQIQYVDMSSGQITIDNFTELNAAIKNLSDKIAENNTRREDTVSDRRRLAWPFLALLVVSVVVIAVIALLLANPAPPFGGRIAFTTGRGAANLDILVMQGGLGGVFANITGNNPRTLIERSAGSSPLAWSPDGEQIAFTASHDGNLEIYVMSADGRNLRNLTQHEGDDQHPAWSPDARHIAFASNRTGDWEIYTLELETGALNQLTFEPGEDQFPSWSPDSRSLVFESRRDGNWEIYIMNADGTGARNFSNCATADNRSPAWSPTGEQIAFESTPITSPGPGSVPGAFCSATARNYDIYIKEVDGIGIIQFTRSPGDDRYPAWSPDGEQLIFASNRDGDNHLYLKAVANYRQKDIPLPDSVGSDASFPAWQN